MAAGAMKRGRPPGRPAKGAMGPNGTGGGTKTYKPAMPKPQHNAGTTSGKHKNAR